MQSKTHRVNLQAILDHVFADEARDRRTNGESANGAIVAVPATRTSEDRSRMRQKVYEELARREEARKTSASASKTCTKTAAPVQGCLFAADVSVTGKARSTSGGKNCIAATRERIHSHTDVRELVATAYRSLMRRLPEDHVVLNPIANAEFIVRCRDLGATVSEVLLNRTLLNNRKAKRHADVIREPVLGLEQGVYDEIGHAVEIAASLVQREWFATGRVIPSVDDILCSPEQRQAFKTYVQTLHTGADIVNCLLVLLAYRKSGRESTHRLASVEIPEPLFTASFQCLDLEDVPESCGVYRVLCRRKPIFVSATENLRQRIVRHLIAREEGFLPASLPFEVDGPVSVQVYAAPSQWVPRRAVAVARSLRIDEYPDLNWREKGALFNDHSHIVPRCAIAV